MDCLFCKIVTKELDTHIFYEDDLVIAFDDIDPKAPHHKLIIPRQHINTLNDTSNDDRLLLGHMMMVASNIAKDLGIAEDGYRVLLNCNSQGGQAVYHLHLHLLAGRQMQWPPG